MVFQYEFQLAAHIRGFHLITHKVLEQIPSLPQSGIFNLFIKHTSAGLTINENADPDVLVDFEQVFNRRIMPENEPYLVHTIEGPDDMPAHIKSTLVGSSISIPRQGIYLCEFRNHATPRKLVATIYS